MFLFLSYFYFSTLTHFFLSSFFICDRIAIMFLFFSLSVSFLWHYFFISFHFYLYLLFFTFSFSSAFFFFSFSYHLLFFIISFSSTLIFFPFSCYLLFIFSVSTFSPFFLSFCYLLDSFSLHLISLLLSFYFLSSAIFFSLHFIFALLSYPPLSSISSIIHDRLTMAVFSSPHPCTSGVVDTFFCQINSHVYRLNSHWVSTTSEQQSKSSVWRQKGLSTYLKQ